MSRKTITVEVTVYTCDLCHRKGEDPEIFRGTLEGFNDESFEDLCDSCEDEIREALLRRRQWRTT